MCRIDVICLSFPSFFLGDICYFCTFYVLFIFYALCFVSTFQSCKYLDIVCEMSWIIVKIIAFSDVIVVWNFVSDKMWETKYRYVDIRYCQSCSIKNTVFHNVFVGARLLVGCCCSELQNQCDCRWNFFQLWAVTCARRLVNCITMQQQTHDKSSGELEGRNVFLFCCRNIQNKFIGLCFFQLRC